MVRPAWLQEIVDPVLSRDPAAVWRERIEAVIRACRNPRGEFPEVLLQIEEGAPGNLVLQEGSQDRIGAGRLVRPRDPIGVGEEERARGIREVSE